MRKNRLFIFSSLLVSLLVTTGCGEESNVDSNVKEPVLYFEGNEKTFKAPDTNKFIVENGVCDYKIIINEFSGSKVKLARDEFIYLFQKATNIELTWTYDKNLTHEAGQKYISIGDNDLFKSSGITIDRLELGNDGTIIKTVDDNIYLIGGADSGTLYSVYDFMRICFNYEQYTHKVMEIDKNVRNLKLKNFDVKNIPDIPMRCHSYGFMGTGGSDYDEKMLGYRLRQDRIRNDHRMPIHKDYTIGSPGIKSTNSNTIIPIETYGNDHPDWFSDASGSGRDSQWCYTAHGNEAEYHLFTDEVARKIEFSLVTYDPVNYPDLNCALVMMEDNFNTCTCEHCMASRDRYGAESAAVIIFMNEVCEKVLAWEELPENSAYKREDLKICFNAYNAFENAPAHIDEATGKYVPNDPDVVMNDHLGVYFAEINNLDNQQSFFSDMNIDGKAMFDGWAALTKWLEFWVYETDFSCAMYFYDSFAFGTQEFYNYIASQNVKLIFSQGIDQDGHCGWTGICWNQLKAYLNSKLSWDSTLDQTELVNNFFNAVYKDAAVTMRSLFNAMRAHYQHLFIKYPGLLKLRSIYNRFDSKSENYFPIETLNSFISYVDKALLEVEKYKNNSEIYEGLFREIEAQAIFPLYVMLDLHSLELTPQNKKAIVDRLDYDISRLSLASCTIKESGATLGTTIDQYR